ncbi:MAG: hypothetical protein ACU0DH_06695 [Paracoccus sp. (in: a-proteobacteria)]|uniref:hypothetical protein n=1 Tax=Paracoccus sp. TaxID=267 RepID=UPI0040597899
MMIRPVCTLFVPALLLALAGPVTAQQSNISAAPECPEPATTAQPADAPKPSDDSTAPENTGTTGWSGGTGGSQLGTNTQGAVPVSPTWQPPTARGLDLAGKPEPLNEC